MDGWMDVIVVFLTLAAGEALTCSVLSSYPFASWVRSCAPGGTRTGHTANAKAISPLPTPRATAYVGVRVANPRTRLVQAINV